MTVKIYQSTDADAPLLTGQAGTLVTVLDKCLVEGYSPRSITSITRSGDVATATTSAVHGLVIGSAIPIRLLIAGADQPEYNGEFVVTPLTTTTFSYAVMGAPVSPATGTITSKRPGLGWLKAFGGVSKAAYQMPVGSTQHYLQVLDDNTASTQRSAQWRGYESMSDVDTGIGPFPTVAQQADKGLWVYKSGTQNSAVRAWKLIGDEQGFYLHTYPYDTNPVVSNCYYFGEFKSFRSGDAFHTAIIAANVEQGGNNGNSGLGLTTVPFNYLNTTRDNLPSHYACRAYTQIGSAVPLGKLGDARSVLAGQLGMPYPNPVDNGYHLGIVKVMEGAVERGVWPGFYQPLHVTALNDGDTVSNLDGLLGRTVLIFQQPSEAGPVGRVAFDVVGPWR